MPAPRGELWRCSLEPPTPDVRALVLRARESDARAYAALLRRYEAVAYRLALRITGNRQDAEDACQEAFLRAFGALSRFDPQRPFGPWLLKIVANRALTRAARRKPEVALAEAEILREPAQEPEMPAETELLRAALARLSPLDRAVLALRYEQGLSVEELAAALGIGESAAKVRLFRARQRLIAVVGNERLEP